MRNLLLILLSLLLTACYPFSGELKVHRDLVIKTHPTRNKTVQVTAGDYKGKVEIAKKKIKLELGQGEDRQKIRIKLGQEIKIPRREGDFSISAADLGQTFSAEGHLQIESSQSVTYREREQCQYSRPVQVCDRHGRCRVVSERVWGWQNVRYYYEYTDETLQLELVEQGDVLATFSGQRGFEDKIYQYQGACF